MYNMKKLFILCGAVAIVAALTGNSATKVQKTKVVPRIIQLQDSCLNELAVHNRWHHGMATIYVVTDSIEQNQATIDSLADVMWKEGCDIPTFDGDIKILIEEEMRNLNNNN